MSGLEGTVKLPAVGTISKKNAVIYVSIAAAVVGIAVYRHNRTAAMTPTDTTVPIADGSTDTTGGAGDFSAGAYGSNDGQYYGSNGYTGAGAADPTDTTSTTAVIANNSQWSAAAVDRLSNAGLDADVVLAALGPFLQGRPVNDAQRDLIEQAVALTGQPPQSGTSGFPPSINHVATPTLRGPLGTPSVASTPYGSDKVRISWLDVPNAKTYEIWTDVNNRMIAEVSSTSGVITRSRTVDQHVWVIAKNVGGGYPNSGRSNIVIIPRIPAPKPAPKKKK